MRPLSHFQMDQADTLGIPKSWGVPGVGTSTGFPGSLAPGSLASLVPQNPTPGSPAKGFPGITQSTAGFGINNITSQLQSKFYCKAGKYWDTLMNFLFYNYTPPCLWVGILFSRCPSVHPSVRYILLCPQL